MAPQQSSTVNGQPSAEAEEPLPAITATMMAERCAVKFPLDAPGPEATGLRKIATKLTVGLVDLAFSAVVKWCTRRMARRFRRPMATIFDAEARNRKLIDATRYCIAQDALSIVCTSYDAVLAR